MWDKAGNVGISGVKVGWGWIICPVCAKLECGKSVKWDYAKKWKKVKIFKGIIKNENAIYISDCNV